MAQPGETEMVSEMAHTEPRNRTHDNDKDTATGVIGQLPLPVVDTAANDPTNQHHERVGEAQSAVLPISQIPHLDDMCAAEAASADAEDEHHALAQSQAAVVLTVAPNAENAKVRAMLDPADKSVSKTTLEQSWSESELQHLVDIADTNQLLTVIAKLDSKPIDDSLVFSHLTFEQNGVKYLNNVSGVLEPGKLVALIGSPDAGITLLLSLLAGRTPLTGTLTGEILYNGAPISAATRQYVGYVVKEDPNLPNLTVYETLNFSARLRVGNESAKLLRFRTLLWMKVLGLSHTYSTVVGDALTRGVSGGERRRVSYGCEMVAGQSLVLADLPTNGLDSTSAFALIENVTKIARTGRAMLVSVVQPSPEMLALFDSITVMSKGAIIYSGPPAHVESYFNSHGFNRPNHKSLPDWVEEMSGTPERFWVSQIPPAIHERVKRQALSQASDAVEPAAADIDESKMDPKAVVALDKVFGAWKGDAGLWHSIKAKLGGSVPYVAPDLTLRGQAWLHLTQAYQQSKEGQLIQRHVASLPRDSADSFYRKTFDRYQTSFFYQLALCFQRQATLTFRNKNIWMGNFIQAIVLGLIIGTLFWNISLSQEAVRVRFGLMFFMVMNMGMGSAQMIPVHFSQRATFYNQRQNGYYNSAAYYLAAYFVQLPIGVIETFLFSIIVYPLAGLYDSISPSWAYLWLVLILVNWVSRAWIMFLVSISPTEAVTQVLQPISMLLFSTMSGFLAPKSSIPSGWSWLYYISFFTYAVRGLCVNEQSNLIYDCYGQPGCVYGTGYQVLALYDMQSPYSERWTYVENLVWFFIAFNAGTALMYVLWQWQHTEVGEPPNFHDEEKTVSRDRSRKMIEKAASQARSQFKVDHKAYIEWKDLCYSVPIKSKETGEVEQRLLLDHTFGYAQPNRMIALMGASGAGKSTLMDVLALKKNFGGQRITGTVLVNGKPQDPITFSRIAGYVEQFDSHNEQSTVREAIEFSARLRLPAQTSEQDVQARIDRVLASLGITHLKDQHIGNFEDGGISPEARKKVTIAVELIMNPSLLFLDEPTTGLDAPGAFSVMKAVRELAREIAVVCTIHQPSAEIVNMFDALYLMKSGGQVAYFGALQDLPAYFAEQRLGIYPAGQNMGDFALSCIKRAESAKSDLDGKPVDVAQTFLQSPQGQHVQAELQRGVVPETERDAVHVMPESMYPKIGRQLLVLTQRFFHSGFRDTNTFGARTVTTLFFAFMIGTLFVQLGLSQLDGSNRVAAVFMSIMYAIFSSPVKAPARYAARPVYFREHGTRMYGAFAYWFARFVADIPTILAEIMVFSLIVYFAAGLTLVSSGTHFALFFIALVVVRVMGMQWNETVTGFFGDAAAGTGLFALSCIICMLFSGFLIQKTVIPDGWIWMYYISFIRYPLSFFTSNELRDIPQFTCDSSMLSSQPTVCTLPAEQNGLKCPLQCGPELLDQFGIQYADGDMILNFFIIVIYAAAFTVFSYLVVRKVNHVKR